MPRSVLLLEDDPAVSRYVGMALEGLPIELQMCESIAQARSILAAHRIDLMLTDLTVVDGSAVEFVQELAQEKSVRVAVFSAGVTSAIQARLEAAGVWRILHKPIGLKPLQACVLDAITPAPEHGPVPSSPATETQAVLTHFQGNQPLFDAFRASCLLQFPVDVKCGDKALQAGDMATLRRIAHNLKTVLRLIGAQESAAIAASMDTRLSAGSTAEIQHDWAQLRQALAGLH